MWRTALALTCTLMISVAQAAGPALDTAAIESATGLKGSFNSAENVFKVTKPRDDIKVEADRWTMPPFMGLTSWAAFTPMGNGVMVMGDTVLFEDEVNPAMSAALDAGLEVTALHNHFFFDRPKVYFMHIAGMGDAKRLGAAVKAMYDSMARVRAAQPTPADSFAGDIGTPSRISAAPIESILGSKAQSKEGMVKVTIGRKAQMQGVSVGNEMGVNTWAAFAGTDDRAVVDGDFAMQEGELQAVLKSMRKSGLNIVAIHQHMTGEQPRIMFLHYWGKGKAQDLARAVKQALDSQTLARGQ
ncbi:MAG TPA: DUF1259 domain-containing protein [Rhodocyclaceae bacterium]|nr:DUF1259 domain-containing protein [Rhodocyclaceae bacterium]